MTTYNTGNPIGSTDSRDRLDNTENMDYLENSTTELTRADRLGTVRKTRHGMEVEHDAQISAHENEHYVQMRSFENDFDARLVGMAFTRIGSFTAGATLTDMRQVLIWEVSQGGDGHEYGWTGIFPKVVSAGATPATSGGIGAGAWVDRTDVTLRSDLGGIITERNGNLSLKHYIHAADYGVVDDYYTITPTVLSELIGGVTGYSYALGINPSPTDNADAIQKAVNSLAPGGVLSFAGLRGIGILRTIKVLTERVTIFSDNKFLSHILPITGFSGTCLFQFGDGTQAYQMAKGIGFIAAVDAGNDVSGIEVNNLYNFEADDIKCQSGSYITRECAGIDIINGKHTVIKGSNLHNAFCYGAIIRAHSTGLKFFNNAFDESDVSIISKGNIVEMISKGNEFGSARPNPSHAAPITGVNIDLRTGIHGSIDIDDLFSGGGGTKYHVRWNQVDRISLNGVFSNASRFSIAGNASASRLTSVRGTFANNGTDRISTDPTTGTTTPDTSPFCCDVHLAKAYLYPTIISLVSNSSVASCWIEGTSSALATSNVSIANCSSLSTNIAYVHGTLIPKNVLVQNGILDYKVLGAVAATITARTVTRGVAAFGSVTVSGAGVGDSVDIVFKDIPASHNLVLTGMVTGNNIVRWVLVNTSDTAVTIPDTIILISVIKAR